MRILWLGNPPGVGSGYGEQAALFLPRLQALGHEVAVACNYGVQGITLEAAGVTLYPSDNAWGNRSLHTYADHFRADVVVALGDAWVLHPDQWPDQLRVGVWAPVDHKPLPPAVHATLAHERVQPIAMSRFGERMMTDAGLQPLYVPHGVDRAVFRPRPGIRDAVRAELGVPADCFLVGMVAANTGNPDKPRKAFDRALPAFARFAADHPDAFLYLHTQASPPPATGVELGPLALASGCPPDRVLWPDDKQWQLGTSRHVVAALYQAFDVLLNPSRGEGFGIPILEAMACGVPVIASDHSAMSELTQAGWLVKGDPDWDRYQEAWFLAPSVAGIVFALESAYAARGEQWLHAKAVDAAKAYDADQVTQRFWRPVLQQLAARPWRREIPPLPRRQAVSAPERHQEAVA